PAVHRRVHTRRVRTRVLQRRPQRVGKQQHLHASLPQYLGEGVVLLLGPVGPWNGIEQQLVVVAWGESAEFVSGAVQQHGPQRADLIVHVRDESFGETAGTGGSGFGHAGESNDGTGSALRVKARDG